MSEFCDEFMEMAEQQEVEFEKRGGKWFMCIIRPSGSRVIYPAPNKVSERLDARGDGGQQGVQSSE